MQQLVHDKKMLIELHCNSLKLLKSVRPRQLLVSSVASWVIMSRFIILIPTKFV